MFVCAPVSYARVVETEDADTGEVRSTCVTTFALFVSLVNGHWKDPM
jgi:hypothetical protein